MQFRVTGPEIALVRQWADKVAAVTRSNPDTTHVQFDWDGDGKFYDGKISGIRWGEWGMRAGCR